MKQDNISNKTSLEIRKLKHKILQLFTQYFLPISTPQKNSIEENQTILNRYLFSRPSTSAPSSLQLNFSFPFNTVTKVNQTLIQL